MRKRVLFGLFGLLLIIFLGIVQAQEHSQYQTESKTIKLSYFFDGEEREIALGAGELWSARFSPNGKHIALLHSSGDSPYEILIYDIQEGELRQITNCLEGKIKREDLVQPQLVVYDSFDQTRVSAFVYVPHNIEADASHPAIVYPHGGPTGQYTNAWDKEVQFLVSQGYVLIAPNVRGSTGLGKEFQDANKGDLGGNDLRDVVAAADFLKQSGFVDPKRIVIAGRSYGGYLTLMALTKYPEIWAAGVAIVPFANWFTMDEQTDPALQSYLRGLMGDPVTNAELWRDRSPFFFANQMKAPALLIAGEHDIGCPPEEIQQMAEAIRQAGGIVETKIYQEEGHWLFTREHEIDLLERIGGFLQKHLIK